MRSKSSLLAAVAVLACASPAWAKAGDPFETADGVKVDPILDLRLRYEMVDQATSVNSADAITARARFGVGVSQSGWSALIEGEATGAIGDNYNDTIPFNGVEPYPVVADPESLELNRVQVAYARNGYSLTVGRQRIILDNARFVGNVGWRQNEQTFDAVRAQGKAGPVSFDATYSFSQRTIFGSDSPNKAFDGDIVLLNAGAKLGPVEAKGFAYLIDYDARLAFASQTYGVLAKADIPLGPLKLNASASYANQSDYGQNPTLYSADYLAVEIGTTISGMSLGAGYEELGSDGGVAAFQTPLATLHAFNGWADMFLTTPATGLRDYYGKAGASIGIPGLTKFTAAVVYHEFKSDFGSLKFGNEWDASLGFKLGPVGLLAKYANYTSKGFAADTEKFWLQAEMSF